ncbi:site-specific integrase [Alteromonas sp. 5E99-2]|uniref:tyrosine-type recombinase/integrase n=1 Tax=Alteromonas sp. 5E99-2 TaxID=2817683 RepID=UPI001A98E190|nr:site-specific integrase [Alteromonas sp. 5E99-2]MBO1256650.1 site-specific integrase [Alteromonas sp. 5E99-2]
MKLNKNYFSAEEMNFFFYINRLNKANIFHYTNMYNTPFFTKVNSTVTLVSNQLEETMLSKTKSKILNTKINLGKLPYFEVDNQDRYFEEQFKDSQLRSLAYHTNDEVENFPLLFHPTRIKECMEFNLYMIERHKGNFSLSKNKNTCNEEYVWSQGELGAKKGKGIQVSSLDPIAKDLQRYLDWMIDSDISYEEIMAVPQNYDPNSVDEAEALLPVWNFREYIRQQIKNDELAFTTGERVLNSLKIFYLWSYRRAEVDALPFSVKYKAISVKRNDYASALFALPGTSYDHKNSVKKYISNLALAAEDKPKDKKPRKGLQPYNGEELKLLMDSGVYRHRTYGLFLKCCLFGGLRSFEVVQINHNEIFNPRQKRVVFRLSLLRKFNKATNLQISATLMQLLWDYTQTKTYKDRQLKHESKYGKDNPDQPLPLFINSSGERMKETSVQNSIAKVRAELKKLGKPNLERDVHDLRATFATYWAIAMLERGYSPDYIKNKLMLLLSHESFRTTQLYLDFAIEGNVGKHGAMDSWVVDIYQEILNKVEAKGDTK